MVYVVKFPPCEDTVALFRVMLSRALDGEVRTSALATWSPQRGHEVAFTGRYHEHPEQATMAGLRMTLAASNLLRQQLPPRMQRKLPPAPPPPTY